MKDSPWIWELVTMLEELSLFGAGEGKVFRFVWWCDVG